MTIPSTTNEELDVILATEQDLLLEDYILTVNRVLLHQKRDGTYQGRPIWSYIGTPHQPATRSYFFQLTPSQAVKVRNVDGVDMVLCDGQLMHVTEVTKDPDPELRQPYKSSTWRPKR